MATAALLAGCATDQSLTTASVKKTPIVKSDAACVSLSSQIDAVQAEGTVARVEKVAEGKTRSAMVKRAALAKVAELNKLNAEYRARCSKPGATIAKAPVAAKAAAQANAAAKAAGETVKQKAEAAAQKQAQAAAKPVTQKVASAAKKAAN